MVRGCCRGRQLELAGSARALGFADVVNQQPAGVRALWNAVDSPLPCQRFARNRATRSITPPHDAKRPQRSLPARLCSDVRYRRALRTTGASMVRMGSPVRFRRGAPYGSDQLKRWSPWRSMTHLQSREPIPCRDAISLGGSSGIRVDTSDRHRCVAPWSFPSRSRAHSGPRTHPWTSKGPMSSRPSRPWVEGTSPLTAERFGFSGTSPSRPWHDVAGVRSASGTVTCRAAGCGAPKA